MVRFAGITTGILVFAMLCSNALAQDARTDQEVNGNHLIDYGYEFEIQVPELGSWQLLDQASVRAIIPEAVAGAIYDVANYLLVIVERAPGVEIVAAASLLIDTMPLENLQIELFEESDFQGMPAVKYMVSGGINGVRFRYAGVVIARLGFLYQIQALSLADLPTATFENFEAMWDRVHFRDAETISGRASALSVPDADGVGWRIRDGLFESAAYGFRLQPTMTGWRSAIGLELRMMHPDAEVGLFREGVEAYVLIIPERATGVDQASYIAYLVDSFSGEIGSAASDTLEVTMGGEALTLSMFRNLGPPPLMDTGYGVFFRGDVAYQIILTWMSGLGPEIEPTLDAALDQFEFLTDAEQAELTAVLAGQPDPENAVADDYALRGGAYRDYLFGFYWDKPEEGYWRVLAGQDARMIDPFARALLLAPGLGVNGTIMAENTYITDHSAAHQNVLAVNLPPESPALSAEPEVRATRAGEVRVSAASVEFSGLEISYVIATAMSGNTLVTLMFYGFPENISSAEAILSEAIANLTFSETLQARQLTNASFIDDRLGFRLDRVEPDWTLENQTPGMFGPMASIVASTRDDSLGLMIFAICAAAEGQDMAWFEQLAREQILDGFQRELGFVTTTSESVTFRGLEGTHHIALSPSGLGRLEVYLLPRGRTFFAVMAYDQFGAGYDFDTLFENFQVLD